MTWQRRLLRLLSRVGLHIVDIAPGTVVVSRTDEITAKALAPGSTLLVRHRGGKQAASAERLANDLHLVASSAQPSRRVRRLGRDWWLIGKAGASGSAAQLNEHSWIVTDSDASPAKPINLVDGLWLIDARAGVTHSPVVQRQVTESAWLVSTDSDADRPLSLSQADPNGWLLTRPGWSAQAEPLLETHFMKKLGERHLSWLLARYKIDCVIDVGANVGQFAQSLRAAGFAKHIISFEPVPQFADVLENAAISDSRWTVHRIALGAGDGTIPIRVQRSFSSVLEASDYGKDRFPTLQEYAESGQIDVPLCRLDSILDEVLEPVRAAEGEKPRVFLKMDTQGFDVEVFRGLGDRAAELTGLLSEVAMLPIYEGMPRMADALATYEAAGFQVTGLYPVSREPDGRMIEYDCVMVRGELLDRLDTTGQRRPVLA